MTDMTDSMPTCRYRLYLSSLSDVSFGDLDLSNDCRPDTTRSDKYHRTMTGFTVQPLPWFHSMVLQEIMVCPHEESVP